MLLNNNYTYEVVRESINSYNKIPNTVLSRLDSMGIEKTIMLNKYEIKFFEAVLGNNIGDFDFNNKKIGFIHSGTRTSNKGYFDNLKQGIMNNSDAISCTLLILTKELKEKSGGHDAVILYWRKMTLTDKDLIKILSKEINDPIYKENKHKK